jgi:hypothetical protein
MDAEFSKSIMPEPVGFVNVMKRPNLASKQSSGLVAPENGHMV